MKWFKTVQIIITKSCWYSKQLSRKFLQNMDVESSTEMYQLSKKFIVTVFIYKDSDLIYAIYIIQAGAMSMLPTDMYVYFISSHIFNDQADCSFTE